MRQLWFTSADFSPSRDEGEATNPGRFGRELADWLGEQLTGAGYATGGQPLAEDWGWVIRLKTTPFPMWIGCGNEEGNTTRWSIFVVTEVGLLTRLFKGNALRTAVRSLEDVIHSLVLASGAEAVEWEEA